MSVQALRWVRGVRGVTSTQKLVLYILSDMANDYGEVWPSAATLAKDCCLNEKSVRVAFDALEEMGLLTGTRVGGRATRWVVNVGAAPKPMSEVPEHKPATAEPVAATPVNGSARKEVPDTPGAATDQPRALLPGTPVTGSDISLSKPHISQKEASRGKPKKPANMEGFEEFWRYFPRRRGRGEAEKAWPKAVAAADGDVETILCGLKVQIGTDALDMKENGKYCPHASTWLNQKRWMDEVEPASSSQPFLL